MPGDNEGNWYWEVIKNGHEVVARGVADTEAAACEQADEPARKAKLRSLWHAHILRGAAAVLAKYRLTDRVQFDILMFGPA
jgi:hypothetical protein